MQQRPDSTPPDPQRAEQAARVRAMLERWADEDVADEPEWEVTQVERVAFSIQIESPHESRGS